MDATTNDVVGSALLGFLDGVLFYRPSTVYLSTPITTGRWFYEELARLDARGDVGELPPQLVAPIRNRAMSINARSTHNTLLSLIEQLPKHTIINPVSLHVADWSQEQYITFWLEVIERSVGRVVFSPGWQFSTGCTHECSRAIAQGIPTVDHDLNPISSSDAWNAVSAAICDIEAFGLASPGLSEAAKNLERMAKE